MEETLTEFQLRLLKLIPEGIENAMKIRRLQELLDCSSRKIKSSVEALRNKGYPIGSIRTKPGGYFIIRNEEELEATIAQYESQIERELKTVMKMRQFQF
ncbi:hypothetical protein [Globicatella sanguinis]